jgi:glutaredoxin 3
MLEGKEVIIYTTRSCPYCHAAKDFFGAKKVSFKEVDVSQDATMRQKLVEMTGGRQTVPQIFIDGKSIGGYDELVKFF